MHAASVAQRFRAEPAAYPWAVAALAVLVYLNALANGFALDDVWIIPANSNVTELSNLARVWVRPYWPGVAGDALGLYRPLTISFFNLEWAIGGGAAWIFHAMNIALHATASVLVWVLASRLVGALPALAGALLFAVHPVHTEAVANVVGQAELLAAVFMLLACVTVLSERLGGAQRITVVTVCYAAAVASKEHGLVLPALVALVMGVPAARQSGWGGVLRKWFDEWRLFASMAALAAVYLLVRWWVLGSALSVEAPWLPFADDPRVRVLTALRVWLEYARLLLFPLELSSDYSVAVILPVEQVSLDVLLGTLLLVGTVLLVLLMPARPIVGLAAGWFLVTILPTSNLLTVSGVVLAERALYLPSVALSLAVAAAAAGLLVRLSGSWRPTVAVAGVLVLIAFGVRTCARNPDWKSSAAVNAALLRDHPESYKAQWYAAGRAFARGDTLVASDRFTLALRMEPDNPQLVADYAEFLLLTARSDSARGLLERATLEPYYPTKVDNLLALAHLRSGECEESLERVAIAERRSRPGWQTRLVRVEALFALGRFDAAAAAAVPMATAPGAARAYRWLIAAHVLEYADQPSRAAAARDSARAASSEISRIEPRVTERLKQLAGSRCRSR